ncbi:unnamed protein product [Cuscuta campestris]|uniref:Uncharacterized protein n=1 Tax=Cuscuta campestris TaxID=132261 RepID=A0A484L9R4_9ASTE|nr:unnamed protein product [Cuscuta campestris]
MMPTPTLHPLSTLIREDFMRSTDFVGDRNDEDCDNYSSSSSDNNNDEDHDTSGGVESQDESYSEDESDEEDSDISGKNLEGDQTETTSRKPQRKRIRAIPQEEWPKDEYGRWVLHCVGNGWVPSQPGLDALNDAIMSSYRDAWPTWTLVPGDVKARWWDFFKDRCTWNPTHTDTMKKSEICTK